MTLPWSRKTPAFSEAHWVVDFSPKTKPLFVFEAPFSGQLDD